MAKKLVVYLSSKKDYEVPWKQLFDHLQQAFKFGATSGNTTLRTSYSDYSGDSETFNYKLEWKVEDVN